MLVLGLILILLAAAALVTVLLSGTGDQAVLYGGNVHLPTFVVFLAGAAALLVFLAGLRLAHSGLGRELRRRKDTRRLRKLEQREADRQVAAADSPAPDNPATGAGPASGAPSDPPM